MTKHIITAALLSLAALTLRAQAEGYTQEGKASFYADKFEGRTTASGERYSHKKATCAHLTLPFGTLVRITNLSNNASAVARVNDRGPFAANRIIDVSKSVAERLGFVSDGVVDVRIEAISADEAGAASTSAVPAASTARATAPATHPAAPIAQPSTTPPSTPSTHVPQAAAAPTRPAAAEGESVLYEVSIKQVEPSGYAVQIASYRDQASVIHHASEVQRQLDTKVRIQAATLNGDRVYRLMVGSFSSRKDAERYRDKIASRFAGCFVVNLQP